MAEATASIETATALALNSVDTNTHHDRDQKHSTIDTASVSASGLDTPKSEDSERAYKA